MWLVIEWCFCLSRAAPLMLVSELCNLDELRDHNVWRFTAQTIWDFGQMGSYLDPPAALPEISDLRSFPESNL